MHIFFAYNLSHRPICGYHSRMKAFLLIIFLPFLVLSIGKAEAANTLKTFETDGCTMFVDGPPQRPALWRHCCEEHDMRYWFGGSIPDMDKTDLRLKACVKEVAGTAWAEIIYAGVRVGHSSPVKNKMRWGWGWMKERPNIALSFFETLYVKAELYRLPYDYEIIEKFIERNF